MGQPTLPAPRWRTGAELIRRREEKRRARARKRVNAAPRVCVTCGAEFQGTSAAKYCSRPCQPQYAPSPAAKARATARARNREHLKRSAHSDITAEQEMAMRRKTRKCPLCGIYMTGRPGHPNSKHLDHIVPICVGGTHTHGNVRIICADCNLKRPKDGSDYSGPVTLWAQGPSPVKRARKKPVRNVTLCGKGLHPWTAENIGTGSTGKKYCRACRTARERARRPPQPCTKCGTPTALPGSQHMCPACIESSARKGAELHAAGGLSWNEIAPLVGYNSGTGAWYAAKRIGYMPAARPVKVERPCPQCGKARPKHARRCDDCAAAKAQEAIQLYESGLNLRAIADLLGYSSITSVSNLMKSSGVIEMRIGRPSRLFASQ